MASIFTWESKVRDYELDSQGIVNHAMFLHYFEQCRSDYARSVGIDSHEYHMAGYDLVVADIQIQYRSPLRAKDEFYVTAQIDAYNERRVLFRQEIQYKKDKQPVAKALVYVACVDQKTGSACMPDVLRNCLPSEKYVTHRLMLRL